MSEAGKHYWPVVVNRATKFLMAYPPPSTEALGVARKLLEFFGLPLSIRLDPGSGFTAEVTLWALNPRTQGGVERLDGWLHRVLARLCCS